LTSAEKEDVFKLLKTLNKVSGPAALTESQVSYVFERLWPDFETRLNSLSAGSIARTNKPQSGVNQILEELLELARFQQKYLSSPELLLPPDYLAAIASRFGNSLSGVPFDYPAWRDLQIAIDAANVALRRFAEGQAIKADEVQSVVSRISDPAEVLLRKVRDLAQQMR
jgi:hypothetical protein